MPDRREFLKYFGIGSVIAPVAASELHARLIEPPKVELVEPPKVELADKLPFRALPISMSLQEYNALTGAFLERSLVDCTITFRDPEVCSARFAAFIAGMRIDREHEEVIHSTDGYRTFVPTLMAQKTITLRIVEEPTFNIPNTHAVLDRAKRARRQPAE